MLTFHNRTYFLNAKISDVLGDWLQGLLLLVAATASGRQETFADISKAPIAARHSSLFVSARDCERSVLIAHQLNNSGVLEARGLNAIPNSDVELAPKIWIIKVRGVFYGNMLVKLPTSQKLFKVFWIDCEGTRDDHIGDGTR
ncbi:MULTISPECIES: hypothetical protein [unclassified Rhizobium]|uniref:hypothetical protein n=1 Tax=unclassified Rhizobium TaxID=2613769 RepID=UPI0021679830|nr:MULTISPECIES: hypothetical protein [unclassified Rhizobium]MCS3742596.1 hypothetical protein [Rhizobium sp. BK661]MCS4094562.1 hypothetical protein [Rhizobium sp. BK176]